MYAKKWRLCASTPRPEMPSFKTTRSPEHGSEYLRFTGLNASSRSNCEQSYVNCQMAHTLPSA